MKSIIQIKYPLSKTESVSWQLHIETQLTQEYMEFVVEAHNDNGFVLVDSHFSYYENSLMSSDHSEVFIDQFACEYIGKLNLPEFIALKAEEELGRRLNEFADFQRNHRLNVLKQNRKIIDGEQLHHAGYLETQP